MSERALKWLVGALVVVAALWGVAALLGRGGGAGGATSPTGEIASFFEELDERATLRFEGPGLNVVLEPDGDGWMVNGLPADPALVENFWQTLRFASIGDRVASNPANHERMGLSADSAWTLDIGEGERVLLVGDAGSRFQTVFVRLPDSDDVYLASGDVRSGVRRTVDQWRDKRVVAVDTAAVARIAVRVGPDRYTLVRGDSAWAFEAGGAADAAAVRSVLQELHGLVAAGFLSESDSIAGLPVEMTVVAETAAGEPLTELTISEGSGDRAVRAAGSDVVYRVPSFRVSRVAPSRESLTPTV